MGNNTTHGFIYARGALTDLNNLTMTGASSYTLLTAAGINDAGEIVGQALAPNGHKHAFLLIPENLATVPLLGSPLVNATKLKGENLTLDPAITGPNLTFVWYKNGLVIPGQTGATLPLSNLQPAQAGNYSVTASNTLGHATSQMTLTITSPLQ